MTAPSLADLTPRQQQVAVLVAQGDGYQEIGRKLGMATRTAEAHVTAIAARLPDDGAPPLRRVMRWMLADNRAAQALI